MEKIAKSFSRKGRLGLAIALNSGITLVEFLAGAFTGSLALLSDAGHNLSDVFSLLMGYTGASLSEREPSEEHTFGYKRVKVLTSLLNSAILFLIGGYILFEAFQRLGNPAPINFRWMVGIGSVALAGNVASIFILKEGKESLNIRAVFLHLFYDSLASVGVIVAGMMIFLYDLYIADLVVSVVIAVFIFWSASDVMKDILHILLQGVPPEIELEEVRTFLLNFEQIGSIHDLHIWSLSSEEKILSCHLCLSADVEEINQDELVSKLERKLSEDFGIRHATIQVEEERVCNVEDEV